MHCVKSSNWTEADDLPFHHYSLQHHAIAWISRHIFDRVTYTARHGLTRGMRRRGGLGWTPALLPPAKEELFWKSAPLGGLVVYDIGAYHGILTLFFASRCARVIAYEPNEANHARLIENIRLNNLNNVRVRKLGVGLQSGFGTLHYSPAMAGGGTLHPNTGASISQSIEITTLDSDIARNSMPAPDLIKIDIEGWELEALQGARETLAAHHPALFLEMHGETMAEKKRKAAEMIEFLRSVEYDNISHVESGAAIAPANANLAAEGHLYCRYTPR
jgi:FkbM family methyltransferase